MRGLVTERPQQWHRWGTWPLGRFNGWSTYAGQKNWDGWNTLYSMWCVYQSLLQCVLHEMLKYFALLMRGAFDVVLFIYIYIYIYMYIFIYIYIYHCIYKNTLYIHGFSNTNCSPILFPRFPLPGWCLAFRRLTQLHCLPDAQIIGPFLKRVEKHGWFPVVDITPL